ncbi:MAG: alpha/beta hydrolase [Lachnospiraceae bacterium]|nr:alpha/beta hydrolase [Lachnospiraceae bacterium]
MAHNEYIREVPGSDTVVFCIHGILGTPDQFNPLLNQIPEEWSVFNILLDGHGKKVQDFSGSSMQKWKGQVQRTLTYLSVRYRKIIIMAHSMGTLFALQAASAKNPRIKALFLIDTPLVPFLRPVCVGNSLHIIWDCIPANDYITLAQKDAFSIHPDKRLWLYLGWIPRYIELFREVAATRKCISRIKIPCRVFLSQRDELVSLRSYGFLKRNPHIKVSMLEGATHFYFSEENNAKMQRALAFLCRKVKDMPFHK